MKRPLDLFALGGLLFAIVVILIFTTIPTKEQRVLRAARSGNENRLLELISSGVSPDVRTPLGQTPLIIATEQGYSKLVDRLLASGANVDAQDSNGWTALMFATRRNDTGLVGRLVAAGASVSLTNDEGRTALDIANGNRVLDVLIKKAPQ